jgi:excisionase family DNA binding protein
MSAQEHEAMMQAEDPSGPPGNGGISTETQTGSLPARFYTVAQVAAMSSVSQDTVRREIASGNLTAHQLRRAIRVSERDFEAWVGRSQYHPSDRVTVTYELPSPQADYRW